MAEHFKYTVNIEGKQLRSVSSVFISQDLFKHHNFEVSLPMRSLVKIDAGEDPFPALQSCIGKDIEINLATTSKNDKEGEKSTSYFKGIVTNIRVSGNWWEHGMVSLVGQSTTILMDSIPNTQAYADKAIPSIYKACVSKHLSSKIKLADNISFTEKLRYTVQYEESDFDFIRRICFEYGEWFYYDGLNLCLGQNPKAKKAVIKRDRLRSVNFDYALASRIPGTRVRDYNKNSTIEIEPPNSKSDDIMAKHSLKESGNLFTGAPDCFVSHPSFASGDNLQFEEKQIKKKVEFSNRVQQSGVMMVSGQTDVAEIQLGGIIKLEGIQHSGEFVVIHLSHNCIDAKNYSNHFRAVPKGSFFPKDISFKKPNVQACTAQVTDNQDPKKLGRVRVQFEWSAGTDSPWIRMTYPHAGDNRGLYFVPEIGDEVMVGFEGGLPEYPYVIGALHNGKFNFSGSYDDDNNLKSIKTKSGNEILFDDNGKMTLRNENNSIVLHCKDEGTIEIITNGDMAFNAGKNITMNAGMSMTIDVAKNLTVNVGGDTGITSDGKNKIESSGDLTLKSSGNVKADAMQNFEIKGGQNAKLSGLMTKIEASTNAEVSGSAMTTIKGALVKIN